MKKFLIVKRNQTIGFISTNLRNSIWGVAPKAKLNEVVSSLQEDYGNVQVQFPKSAEDDLNNRELVAYYKLITLMQKQEVEQARQLKLQFGVRDAKI